VLTTWGYSSSKSALPKLISILSPSSLSIDSWRGGLPDLVAQSWWSVILISLDSALGYNNAFIIVVKSEPPAFAVLLVILNCLSACLLEYLNLECLLLFQVSVEENDSFSSFIYSYFNWVLWVFDKMNYT
jgi:hypothetical protein